MKRMLPIIFALTLTIGMVLGLVSCHQQPPASWEPADNSGSTPAATRPGARSTTPVSGTVTELPPDVAFLNGVSNRGNLLVSLWEDRPRRVIGKDVYEYDIASKEVRHLLRPSDPRLVPDANVSLFDSRLLWTEVPELNDERPIAVEGLGWQVHLTDLMTGEDTVVARDELGVLDAGSGLANLAAHASLNGAYVAWNQLTRNGNTFDSQTLLYDIENKRAKSIARIEGSGLNFVLETPQLSEDFVVWNKVSYDRGAVVAYADVYLLNLSTGEERRLTNNGKSFTPVISGDYVAWQYRSTPEDVYGEIDLYNLRTNQLARVTQAKPREENYGPTIGSRVLTWQPGLSDKAPAYDLRSGTLLTLDTGYITRVFTNNDTVAWQWDERKDRMDPLDRRIRYVLLQ